MTENNSTQVPGIGPEQYALLERLSNACAVSGDEREVRAIILEQVRPLADEVRVDALGSVLAVKHAREGQAAPLRVMLDAHMDEIGLMIVSDDEGGLYRFVKVGGIDDRTLPGKCVLVGKDHIPGVIGARPIHFLEPGETENKIPLDALRIDVGPNGAKVKPGDRVTFATKLREIGPSLVGKALDNRLGCSILVEILRLAAQGGLPGVELLLSWSVQEEIGLRGARVAGYALAPDLAIAIDSTPAYDLPLPESVSGTGPAVENYAYNTRLGAGPALYVADRATLADPRLVRYFIRTAEEAGIPYQLRQPGGGGTDAGAIHLARSGIPAISISVPGRYAHTATMLSRRSDWENTLRLVWRALEHIDHSILDSDR